MSDIDTGVLDSLKVLDPRRPIREADICSAANCSLFDDLVGSGLQCQRAASILQREPSERRRLQVVALEAHDANEHLRSHREIVRIGGAARLAALAPPITAFSL